MQWLKLCPLLAIFVATSDCSEIFTSAGTIGELSFMKEAKNFGQAERRCNELDSNLVEFWYEHEYDQVIPGAIVR